MGAVPARASRRSRVVSETRAGRTARRRDRRASRRGAVGEGRSRQRARRVEGAARIESGQRGSEGNGQAAGALTAARFVRAIATAGVVAGGAPPQPAPGSGAVGRGAHSPPLTGEGRVFA